MIRQIILLIITICIGVYITFYANIFEFELNLAQKQAFYDMFFLILSRHVETTFRENMRVILKLGRGFLSAERALVSRNGVE